MSIESELVEAMARASYDEGAYCGNCGYGGWDTCLDCSQANYGYARKSLAALRAALPEGVVLTNTGLAKVEQAGRWCTTHNKSAYGFVAAACPNDVGCKVVSRSLLTPLEEA